MSKYDLSWKNFRLGHGLYWRKHYPTLQDIPHGKTALIIALCVFLVIALILAVQYQNDAVKAVVWAERSDNMLNECIEGTAKIIMNDKAIVCKKAEVFGI